MHVSMRTWACAQGRLHLHAMLRAMQNNPAAPQLPQPTASCKPMPCSRATVASDAADAGARAGRHTEVGRSGSGSDRDGDGAPATASCRRRMPGKGAAAADAPRLAPPAIATCDVDGADAMALLAAMPLRGPTEQAAGEGGRTVATWKRGTLCCHRRGDKLFVWRAATALWWAGWSKRSGVVWRRFQTRNKGRCLRRGDGDRTGSAAEVQLLQYRKRLQNQFTICWEPGASSRQRA
eukprot:351276-Chlamydomonas_euryale.AAC.2